MKLIPPGFQPVQLAAKGTNDSTQRFPLGGTYLYLYEADYEVECSLDNGEWFPLELGKGIEVKNGLEFSSFRLRNLAAVVNNLKVIYATNCVYVDNTINVVERRNGSAASFVPGGLIEVAPLVMDGTPQRLLEYDANRAESWLWTDGLAYWGPDNTVAAAPFCAIGGSLDGFTRIPAKAEIWVIGDAGVNVGARVISF